MSRVRITEPAEEDLLDILTSIARSSPRAAVRMNDRFTHRFEELADSPELGRRVERLGLGMRRVNEGIYAILFHEIEDGVEIVRVVHGMRDLPARLRD